MTDVSPLSDDEIDDAVAYVFDHPTEAPPALTIADLDRADRALAKVGRLDARMDEVTALYQRRREELDAWYEAEQRRHERARTWVEAGLIAFHERVLADDPKAKTIRLPSGDHKARQLPDAWDFTDEQVFIGWAEPDLLVYPPARINKVAVKQALRDANVTDDGRVVLDSGEVVPGLRRLPGAVAYTAAPRKDGAS